jgi:hypothetical protein
MTHLGFPLQDENRSPRVKIVIHPPRGAKGGLLEAAFSVQAELDGEVLAQTAECEFLYCRLNKLPI